MTEVGAVLVGGGELHDRWSSLVRCSRPLGRGIQRFTGITQEMLADAPGLEAVLPPFEELLRGRVLVAHNAPFDRRVLRQAFDLIGLDWPNPPVLCTAALARKLLPLQNKRGLGVLADALGVEVETAHRALADAETCARVLCAMFPRLCANALTVADALAITGRRRKRTPGRKRRTPALTPPPAARLRRSAQRPGRLPVPRRLRQGAVRRQVDLDPKPRSGSLRALERAVRLDGPGHRGRLPEHELRARRARAREPADQAPPSARQHPVGEKGRAALLHPLPPRHPVPDPRGRLRTGGGARRHDRAAAGPAARQRAGRAARFAVRPAPLRPAPGAPRVSVRVRADGALPVAVPGRPGSEPLPAPARRGAPPVRRAGRAGRTGRRPRPPARARPGADARGRGAAAVRARRVATAAPGPAWRDPRAARWRARGNPCKSPPRSRAAPRRQRPAGRVLARRRPARRLGAGAGRSERARGAHAGRRSNAAGRAGELGAHVPPDEIDELRIVSHLSRLAPGYDAAGSRAETATATRAYRNGSSTTSAVVPPPSPTVTTVPTGASRLTSASAIGPSAGDCSDARELADRPVLEPSADRRNRQAPTAAARAAAGSACRGRTGARRSPARRSSPW